LQRSNKRAILVTGAFGQIGSELVPLLQRRYGIENVIASDLRRPARCAANKVRIETLDCIDSEAVLDAVRRHDIGTIYHLAAMLSATAEREPQIAWRLNMGGLHNVLEAARLYGCRVFFPSTIGAFGPSTPREQTPQVTIQRPTTLYGVTKVAGELLCDYYASRYGIDTRGLRLPGVISYKTAPGGGTTDYAVEMFHYAARGETYPCFLTDHTRLDFMYMPDVLRAILTLMEADERRLRHRNAYNVTAMSLTPPEIAAEIRKHVPHFSVSYKVDRTRQAIANAWPSSLDDSAARIDWGWRPTFDLADMTKHMLQQLSSSSRRMRENRLQSATQQ
jgi:nucleoside-diphosphate-sugar epimerase